MGWGGDTGLEAEGKGPSRAERVRVLVWGDGHQKWGSDPSLRLWGIWGGGQQGTHSPTLGRQDGVRRQGQQFKAAPTGKAWGWGNSWGNMVRYRTWHLNFTRAPHPCHPALLPQKRRAAEIRPDGHGGAGKTLKQQVCPPRSAVCHFGGVSALVRQTHCQSQGFPPPPLFILHPSILFLSPRGWRSAPCPEAGPGAGLGDRGWKGAKTSCEEGAGGEPPPNRRMHGTPSLPCSPAPTARLRSAALGLDGWAGVFWGIDAIGPESSGMALISIAKSSTLSLGPSASPTGAEMLAFLLAGCASHLPAAPEYFPITCRCLAGSSSFLSL